MGKTIIEIMHEDEDTRRALLIPIDVVNALVQNGDAETVGSFMMEYLAYAVNGTLPIKFGAIEDDDDQRKCNLVYMMARCMAASDNDKTAYNLKAAKCKESARARWSKTKTAEKEDIHEEKEGEKPPKTAAKKTAKKGSKKNVADEAEDPEKMAIKKRNDEGRKIFFSAWSEYDPNDRSDVGRRLIRADRAGRNELMERIADIGYDDMVAAIRRYRDNTDQKYRKSAYNFFHDRIFENYLGADSGHGYGNDSSTGVDFDLQEQYLRQEARESAVNTGECAEPTSEELEKIFGGLK